MTDDIKRINKKKILFIAVSITLVILIIAGVMIGIIMSSDKNNDIGGVSSDDTALNNTASNENTISDTNSTNNSNNSTHSASGYSSTDSDVIPTVDLSTRAEKIVKTYEYIDEYNAPEFECLYFDDSVSGNKMPYALYVPENYDPGKKYPVLLYLHGAGEAGNDHVRALRLLRAYAYNYSGDILRNAIIVVPHSPTGWQLDNSKNDGKGWASVAMRILLHVEKTYSCDKNRIYITGVSAGSLGTWQLLGRYPEHFAAAVPISFGYIDSNIAKKVVDIPIWIYHGVEDNIVPVGSSDGIYDAIIQAGGKKVKYTRLENAAHNVHDDAYQDREMWYWMFGQNKASDNNTYDKIPQITVCGSDGSVLFTQSDITGALLATSGNSTAIGITFTDNAIKLLTDSYRSDPNTEFTFNLGNNKLFAFKYTATPTDNYVYLSGTYDYDTCDDLCSSLNKIVSKK